jgi:hypothetical protein
MNQTKRMPEVRTIEEKAIRETIDCWIQGNGYKCKRLHIPAPDGEIEPYCNVMIRGNRPGNHQYDDEIRWLEKDLAVYPPGYKDVCRACATKWRNDQ